MLFAADAQKLMDYIPNLGLDRYNTFLLCFFHGMTGVAYESDQLVCFLLCFVFSALRVLGKKGECPENERTMPRMSCIGRSRRH